MDRLISALSGRPPAIHDSYCFDSLISRASQFQQRAKSGEVGELDILSLSALSARLLGIITEKIYHTGDRSIQCAVDITLDLHSWVQSLPPYLRIWDPDCVHINHVPSSVQVNLWLVHFYSVTLLTWPFLVTCIKKTIIQKRSALACPEGNDHDSLMVKKFAEACVRSATQIIKTIRAMRDRCVVSDREPFTISWLFIAALVLLSNSIFKIFDNPEGAKDIDDAIRLQRESAMTKHHAKVYQSFLTRLQQLLVPDKPSDDLLMSTSSIIETLASSQYPQGTFAGGELPIMGATDAPLLEGFLNSSEDFSLPSVLGLDPTANWLFGYGHMDIN
ncbi:hypothetical protein BJY01DRAFT_230351 [Aspergillus pseudoustus]|uniref:Transcription factor domain-containing protein n=1 Tax=Aspergillus pseudoustus TaxID=1810923 RepID=A0ABR4IAV8_9EURO